MGLFYDDFSIGELFKSPGRTITETDVVTFAGLSGDFVELHTNEEYARQSPFGRRVAHGALVFSISTGLTFQMNLINDTVLAFFGADKLRFSKPVFIGDTVRVEERIIAMEPRGKGRGLVTFDVKVISQNNETVISYHATVLLKRKGAA